MMASINNIQMKSQKITSGTDPLGSMVQARKTTAAQPKSKGTSSTNDLLKEGDRRPVPQMPEPNSQPKPQERFIGMRGETRVDQNYLGKYTSGSTETGISSPLGDLVERYLSHQDIKREGDNGPNSGNN